uniref:Dynein axonemal assembly factor 6 isoform X2 n=1 Tax=Pogona vitticeps TaxID=103695 RepID=A0ABM5EVD1_9SAUR
MASPELLGACPTASLLALAEMLSGAPKEEEEEEEEGRQGSAPPPSPSSASHVGPGSLGPRKTPAPAATTKVKPGEQKGIWTTEEVPEGSEYDDTWDTREQAELIHEKGWLENLTCSGSRSGLCPQRKATGGMLFSYRYEILFRQHVGAEDVFLGMSRKDPSTACCEDMLIKIKLPDTKASDITLDIREKVLDLRSPQKKLLLHLPHPVDTQSGKACFLYEQGLLEVTLKMKREFDFINFA